jgi:hypothetical protein
MIDENNNDNFEQYIMSVLADHDNNIVDEEPEPQTVRYQCEARKPTTEIDLNELQRLINESKK